MHSKQRKAWVLIEEIITRGTCCCIDIWARSTQNLFVFDAKMSFRLQRTKSIWMPGCKLDNCWKLNTFEKLNVYGMFFKIDGFLLYGSLVCYNKLIERAERRLQSYAPLLLLTCGWLAILWGAPRRLCFCLRASFSFFAARGLSTGLRWRGVLENLPLLFF